MMRYTTAAPRVSAFSCSKTIRQKADTAMTSQADRKKNALAAVKTRARPSSTYDKYGSSNPVVRRLMSGFEASLQELFELAAPRSLLDVGCGEGVLVQQWARRLGDGRVVGIDLEEDSIQAGWAEHEAPNLEYRVMEAAELPFADGEFDLASAIEVLEHVPHPEHTVAE